MNAIREKRIYDAWSESDGYRVLVDRLWPRGVSKEHAKLDEWAKDVTPSNQLRKDYHQEQISWDVFASRYQKEIDANPGFEEWAASIRGRLRTGPVTLLTAANLAPHSHVEVLRSALGHHQRANPRKSSRRSGSKE